MRRPWIGLLFALAMLGEASIAQAKPVQVQLHLSVSGARVLVDGDEVVKEARQDQSIEVKPGKVTLRVEHDGFLPWEQQVEVAKSAKERPVIQVLLKVVPPPEPPLAVVVAPPPPAAVVAPPARSTKPLRLAVYETKLAGGIPELVGFLLSDSLLSEVRKLDRVSAISMAEVGEMLGFEQQRQLLGCGDDACMAELGGALGVDELLTSTVSGIGASRILTLRRIDMAHAGVKGSATRRLTAGNGEEIFAVVGSAIEELYPEYAVKAGRERGVSVAIAARLDPPPLPTPVFFTTASLSLAAVAVGTFFAFSYRDVSQQYAALGVRALESPVSGTEVNALAARMKERSQQLNIAFGVAGGLALLAGIEALFTDWHDYRHALDRREKPVALQLTPTGFLVSWR